MLPGPTWAILTDPVCGRSVTFSSPHRAVQGSALFAVCSVVCHAHFLELPSRCAVIRPQAPPSLREPRAPVVPAARRCGRRPPVLPFGPAYRAAAARRGAGRRCHGSRTRRASRRPAHDKLGSAARWHEPAGRAGHVQLAAGTARAAIRASVRPRDARAAPRPQHAPPGTQGPQPVPARGRRPRPHAVLSRSRRTAAPWLAPCRHTSRRVGAVSSRRPARPRRAA